MKQWFAVILSFVAAGCMGQGDPEAGREIALDPERGDCVICHQLLPKAPEQQGNLGPPLLDVGSRLSRQQIRQQVIDARQINPDTLMPPYGTTRDLHRVAEDFKGKPVLTEKEIADVVAWLMTLKGSEP